MKEVWFIGHDQYVEIRVSDKPPRARVSRLMRGRRVILEQRFYMGGKFLAGIDYNRFETLFSWSERPRPHEMKTALPRTRKNVLSPTWRRNHNL